MIGRIGNDQYGIKLFPVSAIYVLLSILVFVAFGLMFYKMSMKHTKRINGCLFLIEILREQQYNLIGTIEKLKKYSV